MQAAMPLEGLPLSERCRLIEGLVLDVDGTLTDGRIIYSDDGREWKQFHVRDGSGLKYWQQVGKRAAFVTGRSSPIVARRAKELGIDLVFQGISEKQVVWETLQNCWSCTPQQLACVGDDLPDLPLMQRAGLAVAVADAVPEVQAAAHYVTRAAGGHGAVREVIELILRAQNLWASIIEPRNDSKRR
jgi:3-deoxy-D-manno-octulosonate 8-phosphate phosphatase (KDO 8-P phosphatase)